MESLKCHNNINITLTSNIPASDSSGGPVCCGTCSPGAGSSTVSCFTVAAGLTGSLERHRVLGPLALAADSTSVVLSHLLTKINLSTVPESKLECSFVTVPPAVENSLSLMVQMCRGCTAVFWQAVKMLGNWSYLLSTTGDLRFNGLFAAGIGFCSL